jgi:deoxyribodipyrimidine photo-lyase
VALLQGGYAQARARLDAFVSKGLRGYVAARAQPAEPQVSMLSPYLHFGQISPVEVALAVRGASAPRADRDSFLEELIVRRELAANFVDNTPAYDRFECLPAWAQRTLALHAHDPRPFTYSFAQLAGAQTHDPYWNAATREMLATGYMQNHMRMYWGKKVLEWSATPQEGYATLLRLNNTYFIDGRDPSSFANVGWVFGLHDRPWPERPVFGNVRYMNAAGLERKTDIKAYVQRWNAAQAPQLTLW